MLHALAVLAVFLVGLGVGGVLAGLFGARAYRALDRLWEKEYLAVALEVGKLKAALHEAKSKL